MSFCAGIRLCIGATCRGSALGILHDVCAVTYTHARPVHCCTPGTLFLHTAMYVFPAQCRHRHDITIDLIKYRWMGFRLMTGVCLLTIP